MDPIYARVSTINHGQDVGLQSRDLRQFAEARGWQIAGEYIDAGVSGTKDSRPELNRLMADAHKRRFDVACVWRFDRFARSVSHLLRALETFKAVVRQIVVHHVKRISFSLAEVLRFGIVCLHADSSIRENARRERGLCLAGFQKKEFGSHKNSS
jgi:predicted site-specific integrase-resolvase